MATGLGVPRSTRMSSRGTGTGRPTIREVCLIGMPLDARDEGWTTGQEVTWQGRGYRITANAAAPAPPVDEGSCPAPTRRYVHLAPCDGDRYSAYGLRGAHSEVDANSPPCIPPS